MRQIVLDTETTGLEPTEGHRIIEIGALEMIERRQTGRSFHVYINPERDVEGGALAVHGITNEFLADKPRFTDLADDFIEFIRDAELIIHNAPFDVGFLDAELARLDSPARVEDHATILDTLPLARELHPGQRVSLDALCKRYEVDNSGRDLHGALLDAELLAEVYLAMTGGQVDLALDLSGESDGGEAGSEMTLEVDVSKLVVREADESELAAHRDRLEAIREAAGHCLWQED
ncbi:MULTISPECIES: DNA polymerase III subunit epsilon [unclassified Wenzhouxiangella]|uniref:DNA polymerase III subunit epsilon n=1 Tax=unclassified Wenzhouxiangella TaxID=2613841 RepID=UPI000E32A420|nr:MULTISPECIES: DNA polymerase III subunit epsilon [unclassified Wenzhouxiangella]RFF26325.1 DNA polymerase III subunit epsilon [Wenzhouxiangella sp. 15181]RFP67405.1 DNA polymerase III subunit epsilon [Wenzhouxiangella sp. 15190]